MVQRIVVFGPDTTEQNLQDAILNQAQAQIIKYLPLINGVAVLVSEPSAAKLRTDPRVLYVDDDVVVRAF